MPKWFEPDGSPVEPGLHPHWQLWDHESQKWDTVTDPIGWERERLRLAVSSLDTQEEVAGLVMVNRDDVLALFSEDDDA